MSLPGEAVRERERHLIMVVVDCQTGTMGLVWKRYSG